MTMEMGNPGIPGYGGFASQRNSEQEGATVQQQPAADDQQASAVTAEAAEADLRADGDKISSEAHVDGHAGTAEEVSFDFTYEHVPGFEASASDCLNRARQIARSLNHLNLSSDHLMLALTMDPNARRLLERVGDIHELREAAMQRLGKMHNRFSRGAEEETLAPTSDLVDIAKKARDTAAEREQLVAVSDLIAAFPKVNGRLTYSSGESLQVAALTTTFDQNIVPRISEVVNQIQALVRDAVTRQQSVQSMLQDLGVRHSEDNERRQREFMDEIRSQIREAVDLQIGPALTNFTSKFETVIAQLKETVEPIDRSQQAEPPVERESPPPPDLQNFSKPRGSTWNWLGLF